VRSGPVLLFAACHAAPLGSRIPAPVVCLEAADGRLQLIAGERRMNRPRSTPALVIQGDADQMRLDRAREMAALLGNGHLAIIPGVSRATQVVPERSVAAWRDFIEQKHDSLGRSF
jgi:hypothetical protein